MLECHEVRCLVVVQGVMLVRGYGGRIRREEIFEVEVNWGRGQRQLRRETDLYRFLGQHFVRLGRYWVLRECWLEVMAHLDGCRGSLGSWRVLPIDEACRFNRGVFLHHCLIGQVDFSNLNFINLPPGSRPSHRYNRLPRISSSISNCSLRTHRYDQLGHRVIHRLTHTLQRHSRMKVPRLSLLMKPTTCH